MEFVLINPRSSYLENDASYPPSGLMHVGREIEDRGHDVVIIDMTGDNKEKIPYGDAYGITCVTPNVSVVKEIAANLQGRAPIFIGGVHPTFLPKDISENILCDSVVGGEFEIIADEFLDDIEQGKLRKFYSANGQTAVDIKKPARHLVDFNRYSPGGTKCVPIYTSRGCSYNCNFCSKICGRQYTEISLEQILEEVEEIIDLGYDNIVFGDDNIGMNENRLKKLMIAVKKYNIKFRLNRDVRKLDEDTFRLAAEAGCTDISFGIESGSQIMLERMNKRASIEDNAKAIRLTKKYGMKVRGYFLVNFPGENEETVKETLDFINKSELDSWLLSNFVPLPGSRTFNFPQMFGITWISKNWDDYYLVGKGNNFNFCFTTDELTHEKQLMHHENMKQGLAEMSENIHKE